MTSPSEPIAVLCIRSGWVSPNKGLREHWGKRHGLKKKIDEQIKLQILEMLPSHRKRLLLEEPRKRRLEFTVVGVKKADPDNLVAGLKTLIDCLKRMQIRWFPTAGVTRTGRQKKKSKLTDDGPGIIWDDDPQWLELGKVEQDMETKTRLRQKYVLVRVFECEI